jgi:hypothetical protein
VSVFTPDFLIKPPWGAPLDRSHPLAQGLRADFLLNEGMGPVVQDAVNGLVNTPSATVSQWPTWGPSPSGVAPVFSEPNNSNLAFGNVLSGGNTTYTFACVFQTSLNFPSPSVNLVILMGKGTAANTATLEYSLALNWTSAGFAQILLYISNGTTQTHINSSSGTITLGARYVAYFWIDSVAATYNLQYYAYATGTLVAAISGSIATLIPQTSSAAFAISTPPVATFRSCDGTVERVTRWDRTLSTQEKLDYAQAPYSMYRLERRPALSATPPSFVSFASAAGPATISASASAQMPTPSSASIAALAGPALIVAAGQAGTPPASDASFSATAGPALVTVIVTLFTRLPDPYQGTSIITGPDPYRGTSVILGPDPRRGTSVLSSPDWRGP